MLRVSLLRFGVGLVGLSALGGLACQRKDASPPAPKANPSQPAALSRSATPPAVVASSASAEVQRPRPRAERFLMTWSAALDRHAVGELGSFYAPEVIFYGRRKSSAEVLAAKRQAFEKIPNFRQRVADVHVQTGPNGFVLRFQKSSGGDHLASVAARLVLEAKQGKLAIVEETDVVTDQLTARPRAGDCEAAVNQIVSSHPVITADEARVEREYPEVHAGGMSYDEVEHVDRFSASQGYFHEDHYEPRWWIDAAEGALTIRDAYTGELLVVTAQQRAIVRRLCSGKAASEAQ